MDKLVVNGGVPLRGTVSMSGSKNAVLPIMAATLLAQGNYTITNVPHLRDVRTMSQLLESLGLTVTFENHVLCISNKGNISHEAPYNLVKTMRASVYVLGPLLSRFGHARVSLPGGCAWGPRPINLHIDGMKKLGAEIEIKEGYILASAKKLNGCHISLDISSVGATGNLLMAAVFAKGTTIIENAAREPEIVALIEFLQKMGALIEGSGSNRLQITGVHTLKPADCEIIPDRIETGTYLIAGHLTGGDIKLTKTDFHHLSAVLDKLQDTGAEISTTGDSIRIQSSGEIKSVDVHTAVYPGFPTDMQAQWMSLMCLAQGSSVVTDTIFYDRFTHVAELQRLGADITLDHNVAVIKGVKQLSGAHVMSTDLRASASLIIAGLIAKGQTDISRVYHIDRGYEQIEKKLQKLGANIRRETEPLIT